MSTPNTFPRPRFRCRRVVPLCCPTDPAAAAERTRPRRCCWFREPCFCCLSFSSGSSLLKGRGKTGSGPGREAEPWPGGHSSSAGTNCAFQQARSAAEHGCQGGALDASDIEKTKSPDINPGAAGANSTGWKGASPPNGRKSLGDVAEFHPAIPIGSTARTGVRYPTPVPIRNHRRPTVRSRRRGSGRRRRNMQLLRWSSWRIVMVPRTGHRMGESSSNRR